MSDRLDVFAVCTPGLEPLVAAEIERLGVRGPRPRHGGVDASVTLAQLWSLNLRLRIATRVLVRVARFKAADFWALQSGLRHVDWPSWLTSTEPVVVRSASSSSALFHTGAIEERAAEVLATAGFTVADGAAQVVHLRIVSDVAIVSLDASGDPLYRRGWRLEGGKAPMRETLAAALVAHSGWDRKAPLVDPFCGSGTIAIEAALAARRIAAGRLRSFAFEQWPTFDAAAYERLKAGTEADVVRSKATIIASDRDAGAIGAAVANAERAGVLDDIEFTTKSISEIVLPKRAGWVVTNPPYGERVGGGDLRDLYDRFGAVLRAGVPGWRIAVVDGTPADHDGPSWVARLPITDVVRVSTSNGGLPVSLVAGGVVSSPKGN